MKHLPIGSISSGTLKETDLIPAFAGALAELAKRSAEKIDLSYVLTTLEDTLIDLAPPYCYFGAREGDGADFGFWFSQEALNEAIAVGEVYKLEAGVAWDAITIPAEADYVLEVTDHGNITLFDLDHNEIWSLI